MRRSAPATPPTRQSKSGEDRNRKNQPREDPRIYRRTAEDRPRLAARTGRLLVRDRRGLALAVPSVRAPSDRDQLRATEPALCQVQAGEARLRPARVMETRATRRRVRGTARQNLGTLRQGAQGRDSRRGCALRPAQCRADEFPCDGELRRDAPYLRPAPVRARAMGNPPDGRVDARRDKTGAARNRGVPATEMWREPHGLLRRVARRLG